MATLSIVKQSAIRKSQQQGIVLIMLLVIIALSFITYSISQLSVTELTVQRDEDTRRILKKAKQALIAFAIRYPEHVASTVDRGPGYMPCPDFNNNGKGVAAGPGTCIGGPRVGRLPWITLGTGDLRDGANERLWYAVSNNFDYTNAPTTFKINSATRGTITIRDRAGNIIFNGTTNNGVVAVIMAPGAALTRDDGTVQTRSVANENAAIHYLDIVVGGEDNADFEQGTLAGVNDDGFIHGTITDAAGNIIVNDIIEVITYNDIMDEVHKRASQEISDLISDYFTACGAYPEASVFDGLAPFDSAGIAPPAELREGHLPLGTVMPVDWGTGCAAGIAIPQWLIDEAWAEVTYYAFAYQNPPPANIESCGDAGMVNPACMTISNTTPLIDNAQALIMFAGRNFTGGRPGGVMGNYFEGENSDLDDIYDASETEDYIRLITP